MHVIQTHHHAHYWYLTDTTVEAHYYKQNNTSPLLSLTHRDNKPSIKPSHPWSSNRNASHRHNVKQHMQASRQACKQTGEWAGKQTGKHTTLCRIRQTRVLLLVCTCLELLFASVVSLSVSTTTAVLFCALMWTWMSLSEQERLAMRYHVGTIEWVSILHLPLVLFTTIYFLSDAVI